jgi:hypothetical protein
MAKEEQRSGIMSFRPKMSWMTPDGWPRALAVTIVLGGFLAFAAGPAFSQAGGSKQATKFRSQTENTKKAVEQARAEIQSTMELYNALMAGKDKKPENTYKKLSQGVDQCEKKKDAAKKSAEGMKKEAEKFFAAWEKEQEKYTSEDIKKRSEERLQFYQDRFKEMTDAMTAAGEAYQPFIGSLRDQVMLLGNDLSEDGIASLQGDAKTLNASAETLFQKIDVIFDEEARSEKKLDEEAPAPVEEAGEATGEGEEAPAEGEEAAGGN